MRADRRRHPGRGRRGEGLAVGRQHYAAAVLTTASAATRPRWPPPSWTPTTTTRLRRLGADGADRGRGPQRAARGGGGRPAAALRQTRPAAAPMGARHRGARSRALLATARRRGPALPRGHRPVGPSQHYGLQLARTHLLYGEWLRRESRRAGARGQLRGRRAVRRHGRQAFADRARCELLATGERVRNRTTDPPARLARETQIGQLAGDGLSNPEIAAQLFMSPRTVGEYRLHKISPSSPSAPAASSMASWPTAETKDRGKPPSLDLRRAMPRRYVRARSQPGRRQLSPRGLCEH